MILKKTILILIISSFLFSCAEYQTGNIKKKKSRSYFTSSGFALIYDENLFLDSVIDKKMNNDDILIIHDSLKTNTLVKIFNPANDEIVETKIYKNANYPKIFNAVITKKVATILDLDLNNPFIEISEVKKNKTFIAKKSNTYEEEKNVAEKAPVEEIKVDNISNTTTTNEKILEDKFFNIIINDFYYEESAIKLKNNLEKNNSVNNLKIKKIGHNKYRLLSGPFKNFNALKTSYISLNNSGFQNLNIYKD